MHSDITLITTLFCDCWWKFYWCLRWNSDAGIRSDYLITGICWCCCRVVLVEVFCSNSACWWMMILFSGAIRIPVWYCWCYRYRWNVWCDAFVLLLFDHCCCSVPVLLIWTRSRYSVRRIFVLFCCDTGDVRCSLPFCSPSLTTCSWLFILLIQIWKISLFHSFVRYGTNVHAVMGHGWCSAGAFAILCSLFRCYSDIIVLVPLVFDLLVTLFVTVPTLGIHHYGIVFCLSWYDVVTVVFIYSIVFRILT